MWSVIVALPAVQAKFGVARSTASLPYTMTMICFGFGGILMGRLSDRFGIMAPIMGEAISLGLGYAVASQATSLWQFILAQGLLVGVASSATFAPLHRRHLALVHPPSRRGGGDHRERQLPGGNGLAARRQHFIQREGWRYTYLGIAVFCVATMVPLALTLRRRSP